MVYLHIISWDEVKFKTEARCHIVQIWHWGASLLLSVCHAYLEAVVLSRCACCLWRIFDIHSGMFDSCSWLLIFQLLHFSLRFPSCFTSGIKRTEENIPTLQLKLHCAAVWCIVHFYCCALFRLCHNSVRCLFIYKTGYWFLRMNSACKHLPRCNTLRYV